MNVFQVGDRVTLVSKHGLRKGLVEQVNSATLSCVDEWENRFFALTEDFILDSTFVEQQPDVDDLLYPDDYYEEDTTNPKDRLGVKKVPIGLMPAADAYEDTANSVDAKKLVGFTGHKGSGKDTAAKSLTGYENVKMAGALKEMICAFMRYVNIDADMIRRCTEGDMKESPMPCFGGKTMRHVMQTLGTEWGRNLIDENLWINAFKARAALFNKVVCTDIRFPNEAQAIKDMNGILIRLNRHSGLRDDHPSEAAISFLPVDIEVYNWGTKEELDKTIKALQNLAVQKGGD